MATDEYKVPYLQGSMLHFQKHQTLGRTNLVNFQEHRTLLHFQELIEPWKHTVELWKYQITETLNLRNIASLEQGTLGTLNPEKIEPWEH